MSRTKTTKRRIVTIDLHSDDGRRRRKTDLLATEEPLEIQLSAGQETRTVAITMRTPGNDYELAAGFLYSEAVIHDKHDLVQMTYCVGSNRHLQEYNSLDVHMQGEKLPALSQLERHFFTNSACGICGATMLEDLHSRNLPPIPDGPQVAPAIITSLPQALLKAQKVFESTGGLHAAALFDSAGQLLALREDVGRHNALDKVIGWALMNRQLPLHNKIILVSGRASYELLQKCLTAGAPIFCAVSAPSSLAVELAAEFGITLIGFLRGERFNIYTGAERIADSAQEEGATG